MDRREPKFFWREFQVPSGFRALPSGADSYHFNSLTVAEECPCSSFKIYGKYRSCVNTVIIPMRKFSLIDATAKAAVAAANTACKADIKARKKGKDSKIF